MPALQSTRPQPLRRVPAAPTAVPSLPDDTPLHEARAHVLSRQLEGTVCPCCDQVVQLSRIELTAELALTLVVLHRVSDARRFGRPTYADAFLRLSDRAAPVYHLDELIAATPGFELAEDVDLTALRHWGLIEPTAPFRLATLPTYWRITPLGRLFAMDQSSVARVVWARGDERVEDIPPDTPGARDVTTVRAALARDYDYDALMMAPVRFGIAPARREVASS